MKKELIIVGANGALGKGITGVLLKKNFERICLCARNFDGMENITGNAEKITVGDMSVEEQVETCFNHFIPSKDTLYFLYSTIGGFSGGKYTWDWDEKDFQKMMQLNIKPAFLIARYFSRLVQHSAGGSICFTAAMVGLNPEPKKSLYGASKAALIHLVETLALEGKDINLTANALAPYIIDTPDNRQWMQKKDYESMLKPEEIGEFVYNIFVNFHFISGNIIKMPGRLQIPV